jgi:hypothetical protein
VKQLRTIGTMLLLLITLLMISGVAQTACQLTATQTVAACCPDEAQENEAPQDGSPCNSPDCSCLACCSVEAPSMFTLQTTRTARTGTYLAHQYATATGHHRPIDYPPETTSPAPAV